jgi:hypothetical protein
MRFHHSKIPLRLLSKGAVFGINFPQVAARITNFLAPLVEEALAAILQ